MADKMTGTQRLEYMRQSLAEGGSVFYKGRQIFTEKDLPTLTDLAVNDEERQRAAEDLQRRRQELDQEELRLKAETAPGTASIGTTEVPATRTGRQVMSPGAQTGAQAGGKEGGGKESEAKTK